MKFKFTKNELKELFIAVIMLSIAFSILFAGGLKLEILLLFPMMFLVVMLSFVVHELSHKYFAQKYNYLAEFKANKNFLFITVILSIFGIIIAAPGAVYIHGTYNIKKQGIIALSGPASNIIMAIIFLTLSLTINIGVFYYIYFINAILGLFNMLPIPIFDGFKVWNWNKTIYIITEILAFLLYSGPLLIV
jgi:Zn-dependent protease